MFMVSTHPAIANYGVDSRGTAQQQQYDALPVVVVETNPPLQHRNNQNSGHSGVEASRRDATLVIRHRIHSLLGAAHKLSTHN